jgi:carbon starvation protein
MMGVLVAGIAVSAVSGRLEMAAPAINTASQGASLPSMWPLLFVTIACGAISGFHSLVASGTSTKQVANERDSLFVGYGSMLVEGFLAILVIVCVGAGIGMAYKMKVDGVDVILAGKEAWRANYSSWSEASKIGVVVTGAANIFKTVGLPEVVGMTLMGVFIASFAGTTLDTAVRIQRYVIGEIAGDIRLGFMTNRWTATTFAVITAAALAFASGADGKGALMLWPMFGAANQLLAALALLVVTMYLRTKGGMKYVVSAIPCLIMLVVTVWAMALKGMEFYNLRRQQGLLKSWLIVSIALALIVLALWMTAETVILFFTKRSSSGATAP